MMFQKTKFFKKSISLIKNNMKKEMNIKSMSTFNKYSLNDNVKMRLNTDIGIKIRNYATGCPFKGQGGVNPHASTTVTPTTTPIVNTPLVDVPKVDVPIVNTPIIANTPITPISNQSTNVITENIEKIVDTTATTSGWTGPVDYVQMLLEYTVETMNVPFYMAIVGFTVGVRVLISPLSVIAYRNLVFSIKHAPAIRLMTQNIKNSYQTGGEAKELAMREFNRWKKENNYSPLRSFVPIIIQIPVFICVFLAIRRFAYDIQPEEFINGGIAWFKDLSKSDPYWRFPIISAAFSYLTSEVVDATPKHHKGPFRRWITRFAITMGFFVSGWFPCGMQLYWLTANFMTMAINGILYLDPIRKLLGIPSKKEINAIDPPPSDFFRNPFEKDPPTKPAVNPKKAYKLMKQRYKNDNPDQEQK
eukprot:TRINITY_DN16648_c0_g1_i1.p1 TRINITY_DN16648_c0_g1~~TRINITY_DN16648_c0_g1_i1.p1  ORF type:complete len:417 (-),score=83.64 TRINITY_DN16648_c0_g1_i1:22-1272(-)